MTTPSSGKKAFAEPTKGLPDSLRFITIDERDFDLARCSYYSLIEYMNVAHEKAVSAAVREAINKAAEIVEADCYGDEETEERRIHNENQNRLAREIRALSTSGGERKNG